MWFMIIGTVLAAFAAGLLYISFRAARFSAVLRLTRGKKGPARLLCLAFFGALTALLWATLNMMNASATWFPILSAKYAGVSRNAIGRGRRP